jgi:hypothetical protein
MEGFNVIPVDKDNLKAVNNSSLEFIDEEAEKAKATKSESSGAFILFVSVLIFITAFGSFIFLVVYRMTMLQAIGVLGQNMREVAKNIDTNEIEQFKSMDNTLKTIDTRLKNHTLNSVVMEMVNKNIKSNLQVSEYHLDVRDKEVEINITAIAPTFKDFAEQTERFFLMREQKIINSFMISSITYESDTKRLKFSIRVLFDRSQVSASNFSSIPQN